MSLQPGPQDPNNDSSLTPPVEPPTQEPAGTDAADLGPAGSTPGDSSSGPTAPSTPPSSPGPATGPHPPAPSGWAAPPPPGPNQAYAPPPPGSYAGPPAHYPPPGYPPQGYQAVGFGQPAQTDSKAIIGLVLAISSWLVCPVITAVIALVLAAQSNRAIDESGGRLEGRTLNTATKVISWINIALSIIALLVLIGFLILAASTDATTVIDMTGGSTQF